MVLFVPLCIQTLNRDISKKKYLVVIIMSLNHTRTKELIGVKDNREMMVGGYYYIDSVERECHHILEVTYFAEESSDRTT